MGGVVFNQILHLVACGYTVNFSRADEYGNGNKTLRIELRDGEYRHVEFVDMSVAALSNMYDSAQANTEYFISRALTRARDELDYYIKNLEDAE